jgi:hypothetical protein
MSICQIITNPAVELIVRTHHGQDSLMYIGNETFELLEGWQQLDILNNGNITFEITDILIDGQSIGENLYTCWYIDNSGTMYQPKQSIPLETGTWSIILHSDISVLKERICSQLPNGSYGSGDLVKQYQWFVDLGYKIKNPPSTQIDNFFSRSQGLNFYPKEEYHNYPYIPLNIKIDNAEAIGMELKDLSYNFVREDGAKANPGWINSYISSTSDPTKKCRSTKDCSLPELKKWLEATGITEFNHIAALILPSGRGIEMHRDYMMYDKDLGPEDINAKDNIYSLHIPILDHDQSKIKVAGGGIMPNGINILNNAGYVHAGINEGPKDRYVLTIKNPKPFDFIVKNWIIKSNIYFS